MAFRYLPWAVNQEDLFTAGAAKFIIAGADPKRGKLKAVVSAYEGIFVFSSGKVYRAAQTCNEAPVKAMARKVFPQLRIKWLHTFLTQNIFCGSGQHQYAGDLSACLHCSW